MEKVVSKVLNKFLGDFIQNLDSENLDISLCRGKIEMRDLKLKQEALHILGLPFNIAYGVIKSIDINIKWTKLNSSPLRISISGFHVYITPKDPKTWEEGPEKIALCKSKVLKLKQFEALQVKEITEAQSEGGFFKRHIMKIIDNIQIELKDLYIRYEHNIQGSEFTAGIFLKALKAETCDENWDPKFNENSKFCNKRIKIECFSMFFDHIDNSRMSPKAKARPRNVSEAQSEGNYGILRPNRKGIALSGVEFTSGKDRRDFISVSGGSADFDRKKPNDKQKFQKTVVLDDEKESLEAAVNGWVLVENYEGFEHNYIIKPVFIECKATICKDRKDHSFPFIYTDIFINSFKINIYTGQIILLSSFFEFMRLYKSYKAGIKKLLGEKPLIDTEKLKYKALYENWLDYTIQEKKKKAETIEIEMKNIEDYIIIEDILNLRREIVNARNSKKMIDFKEREIEKLSKQLDGKKQIKKRVTKENVEKSQKISKLLDEAREEKRFWEEKQMDINYETGETWTILSMVLTIEGGGIEYYDGGQKIFETECKMISLVLNLLNTDMKIDFVMSKFDIINYYLPSVYYPKLMELDRIEFFFALNPLNIELKCSDIYIFLLIPSIMKILVGLKEARMGKNRNTENNDGVKEKYIHYIEIGKNYISDSVNKSKNVKKAMNIKIDTKAPVVIIPIDSHQKSMFLRLDCGDFRLSSLISEEKSVIYDNFAMNISNFALYLVDEWVELKVHETYKKIHIIKPINIYSGISKPRPNTQMAMETRIKVEVSKVEFYIKSKTLSFFSSILVLIKTLEPKNPAPVKNTNTPAKKLADFIANKLTTQIKISPKKIDMEIKNFKMTIEDQNEPFLVMNLKTILVEGKISELKVTTIDLKIMTIGIQDLRKVTVFPNIAMNPTIGLAQELRNDPYQMSMTIVKNPWRNCIDICMVMSDIKVYISREILSKFMELLTYKNKLKELMGIIKPLTGSEYIENYYTDNDAHLRLSLLFHSMELRIPADFKDENSQMGNFFGTCTIIITRHSKMRSVFTQQNTLISKKMIYKIDELELILSHFYGEIKNNDKEVTAAKHFIQPSRLTIESKIEKNHLENVTVNSLTMRIESMCMFIGLRDIIYLKMLGETFAGFKEEIMNFQQEMERLNEKISDKPKQKFMNMGIDADAIQVSLLEDTGTTVGSLFNAGFSNFSFQLAKGQGKTGILGEFIVYVSYYNDILGCWEPLVEDLKLGLTLETCDNKKSISLKTDNVININFTHQFLVCLGKTLDRSSRTRKSWLESKNKKKKVFKSSDLEYVVYNKLSIPFNAWLSITDSPNATKILQNNSYSFFQHTIASLYASANKKTKATLLINKIQIPTSLSFSFANSSSKSQSIYIDKLSKNIMTSEYNGKTFKFFINIFPAEGKRMIVFESSVLVGNNCDFDIECRYYERSIEVKAGTVFSVPIDWTFDDDSFQVIIGDKAYNSYESAEITVKGKYQVVIRPNKYVTDNSTELLLIEISPRFHISNLLHAGLNVIRKNNKTLSLPFYGKMYLDPGKESILPIRLNSDYTFLLNFLEDTSDEAPNLLKHSVSLKATEKADTGAFKFLEKDCFVSIKDQKSMSIRISPIEKVYKTYKYYDLQFGELELNLTDYKISNESLVKSTIYVISADYIVINKSTYNLELEDLQIPRNSVQYYSSDDKHFRLKIADFDTKWSENFRLNTIGVTGMVKVSVSDIVQKPQHCLFGLVISQAPAPMTNSNLIKFAPRFLIWNLLNLPIFIRQKHDSNLNTIELPSNADDNTNCLEFNFYDYEESKSISISTNQKDWSGEFCIENIEDFQVKVKSERSDNEKQHGLFNSQWYIPSDNRPLRYIRVLISTSDEATIHIVFMNPKDPDFRIVNKSQDKIYYRQLGIQDNYMVLDGDSTIPWTWDNHLAQKKKIEISDLNESFSYSIERVKEYQKGKSMNFEVSVEVNDSTREMVINMAKKCLKNEEGVDGEPNLAFELGKKSMSLNDKVAEQEKEVRKKHLKKMSLDSISEMFTTITTQLDINLDIQGIGMSIFNKSNHELFYISLQGLNVNFSQSSTILKFKKEVSLKARILLDHFQIDSSDSNPSLFSVIISPIKESETPKKSHKDKTSKEKNIEKDDQIKFLMFEIEMETIYKKRPNGIFFKSMVKVENLEFLIQKIQIKLNEEIIYKLLQLKDYPKALKIHNQNKKLKDLSPFSTNLPILPYEKASILTKAYFRFVKMGVLHISLTFKKATSNNIERQNVRFLYNLLKSFGGAFANITDSPLYFNEILVTDSFETNQNFAMLLAKNYIRQGIIQIYKIFGSIDILGNPLELVGKLGRGVYEFIAEPAKGLLGGPKAFAKGLGKGVKSLVSGVVGGSFESVSKISGGLYIALKNATGDTIVQRPDDESIGKNMLYGFKEGAVDVYEGFKGMVTKPFKGARDKGTKGFFQGLLWGAAGLATSPIKLVLKVSNVISSSISNTTFLLTKGKIQKYGRVRYPRHIRINQIIECYNPKLAQAQAFLYTLIDYRKEALVYFSEISLQIGGFIIKDAGIVLLLTPENFLYIVDGELKKAVKITSVSYLEMHLYEGIYFLCIANDDENFAVPSFSYPALAGIYNVMASFNKNLKVDESFRFERPSFISKGISNFM
ncbi:hypothetical protein SteCoe_29997 [Stentor coeruleus]|uniref:Chorein N-terminal domain-containing protein n=1 Tax=Stentor coeruleus TaxID=5963 RepID=A0A1R2B4J2_9CILI|nr:hypothetical protein SteCoe_29997 [Stentor coeruleus]